MPITEDRPSTADVAALLREKPAPDAPEPVKAAWLAHKHEMLAQIEGGELVMFPPDTIPDCPAWCPLPKGHVDPVPGQGGWDRFHEAWSGTMTYRDCLGEPAEIRVEVSQFEAGGPGEDHVIEPPKAWLRGVNDDNSLSAADMAAFADLVALAASTMLRITGEHGL